MSALDLLRATESRGYMLSTGDDLLDNTLGGGVLVHGITEVSGEAGAGKTQLCLTLALQCHLERKHGGLASPAIYLCCGEGQFPDRRLEQLAAAYASKWEETASTDNTGRGMSQRDFMSNVLVETVHHTEQALEMFGKQIPDLCRQHGVRLLILDSLAGLARTEFDSSTREDMKARTTVLFNIATKLKWLADTFGLVVVVVNQVTAGGFEDGVGSDGQPMPIPALGLVWSTCIDSRIVLRRNHPLHSFYNAMGHGDGSADEWKSGSGSASEAAPSAPSAPSGRSSRTLHLEMSPMQALSACSYEIAADGLHGLHRLQ